MLYIEEWSEFEDERRLDVETFSYPFYYYTFYSDSETFDLAGQNTTTISNNIQSAFSEPFSLTDMIRITFITGAGKLGRQKYDDGAAMAITRTLRDLGFEEDRGASCVVECAGSFKLQHDTGKNLKTVVVFPKIVGASAIESGMSALNVSTSLLDETSPEHMIAMSSKTVFESMLTSKCPSWSQKKGCMAALEMLKAKFAELDAKLLSGTPLNDAEQDFFDGVSLSALEEKETLVKHHMQQQVEEQQNITKAEKESLVKQVLERLETITSDIKESVGKPKKLEKLEAMKTKVMQRKELLEKITPKVPHKLKHEVDIQKLRAELKPLQALEDGAKGRLLTVKETQTLARKVEILEEIGELEQNSRGWFEDDDAFQARIDASRAAAAKLKAPAKKAVGKPAGTKSSAGAYKVVMPGAAKTGAWGKPPVKKSTASKGGGVFAAMMADSDSD